MDINIFTAISNLGSEIISRKPIVIGLVAAVALVFVVLFLEFSSAVLIMAALIDEAVRIQYLL